MIAFLIIGCQSKKTKYMEEKINDYIRQISNLKEKVANLEEDKKELLDKLEKYDPVIKEKGECTFIKTYNIVDILRYQSTDNLFQFVILDQFEINKPFIVSLTKDQVSKLEKNKNYEFTFSGNRKNKAKEYYELFENYQIDDIRITNKIGLDQLQESCT